jgi:hypothetical protein
MAVSAEPISSDALAMEGRLHEAALPAMNIAIGGEQTVAQEELHTEMPAPAAEEAVVRDEDVLHEVGVGRQKERGANDVDAGEIAVVAGDLVHEAEPVGIQAKEELAWVAATGAGGATRRLCGQRLDGGSHGQFGAKSKQGRPFAGYGLAKLSCAERWGAARASAGTGCRPPDGRMRGT